MNTIKLFLKAHTYWLVFGLIVLFFICLHIPGVRLPYHQDEYKWPMYANPTLDSAGAIPHPPLTEFLYRIIGGKIGLDNFRFIPFFFGVLNIFLVFYLAKTIFNKKTALFAVLLFAVSFYSLLASLMVDVDGAVMPFFFLLSLIGYYKLKEVDFDVRKSIQWLFVLGLGVLGGFLIKVVFVIPIAVLAIDFAIEKSMFSDKKKVMKVLASGVVGVCILVLILVLAKFVFPFFKLDYAIKYWEHFINFGNRNWFQILIQVIKSILYLSPLLLLPVFFIHKELFKKTRPLCMFLVFEIIFYLVLFDFSSGALDRYFQFMIIPLCIISAGIISEMFELEESRRNKEFILLGSLVAFILLLLVFIPHFVPALHPKSAWLSRIVGFKWNFLYPFSGGSGPMGFYVSFLFMSLSWIISVGLIILGFFKPTLRKMSLLMLIPIGIIYNLVFSEEYLFGKINGSAPMLLTSSVEYIKNNPNITSVVVYNDNGGYEIQKLGKYSRRLYADPAFENGYKDFFKTFSGHVLYINVPRIDPNSFYSQYLNSCKNIFERDDQYVSAIVYDCQNIKNKK